MIVTSTDGPDGQPSAPFGVGSALGGGGHYLGLFALSGSISIENPPIRSAVSSRARSRLRATATIGIEP